MADYRIQVGVELNTKDIDSKIKGYKAKPIEIGAKLNTSDIDKKLASYKAKKPIEVNAKLNTTGLAKKIGEYKPKTPVKIEAKLDMKNIDAAIRNYKAKKAIEVNVKLNHIAISEQIRNYRAKTPIKLNTRLDNSEISNQIKNYQAKTPIKLNVKLTTKDIDDKIKAYKAKAPIKLDVKINKGNINEQIKSFVPKGTIQLKASLQKGVIAEEIRNFKPATPIKVDLALDPADIDNKINVYKSKPPVEIPAKLKLNVGDISEQLRRYKLTVPIKFNAAEFNIKDIEEKIKSYKASVPIKVGIELDGKNIVEQIKKYGAKTPIRVDVRLDTKNIEEKIKGYKAKSLIKVGVKLDAQKINEQISGFKIKSPIKVSIKLDTSNAKKQIDDIKHRIQGIGNVRINLGRNGGIDTSTTSSGIQRVIKEEKELAQTAAQTASSVAKSGAEIQRTFTQITSVGRLDPLQLQDDISEVDRFSAALSRLKNIQSNIQKVEIGKIDTSNGVQQLKTLESQLKSLSAKYNETVAEINGMGGVSATQLQTFQNQANTTALHIDRLKQRYVAARTELEMGIKSNFGSYEAELLKLQGRFNNLSKQPIELETALNSLKQALSTLKKADGTESLVDANKNYLTILKQVKAQLDLNAAAEQSANGAFKLEQSKQQLALQMNSWLKSNSAAAKEFGGEIQRLQVQLKNCSGQSDLYRVGEQFKTIKLQAKEAGVATLSFGDRLKKQFAQYSSYISVYTLFMYATRALRSMFNQIKEIDSAMTELKKVTNETEKSYSKFLSNAASKSKEIGTTISGLVDSTADFARLGYSFEDAQGLAEVANIYAVVGDEIEGVEQATESLISTMAAFKDEASEMSNTDFAMSIIDKFNEIGNNFAISSGGIGEALERSASSLDAANNTIDESIALITAANTVVQNPDQVGTAFKTISMRIRGAKTELEEAGLETDGMVESTAKLREEILALSGVDIMENANEFKSTYKIMDELAAKWQDLTDIQQATITELIAGKVFCQSAQKCA